MCKKHLRKSEILSKNAGRWVASLFKMLLFHYCFSYILLVKTNYLAPSGLLLASSWNGLRTKKVLTCYKNTICFCISLCYILPWLDITGLKFGNHYFASTGAVVSMIVCHCYCPSSNPSTIMLLNSNGCLNGAKVANSLHSVNESLKYLRPNGHGPFRK